jgi:MurNAc alpha-1-phosphate uridylyltransferase
MIAMILAAGRGERLRPITDSIPKALVEVGGESLLERHLRMLVRAGFENVVINIEWLGEQIIERIGDGHRYGLHVTFSPEFDGLQGTGGGIRRALPLLGSDPFWVINADVYTDLELPDLKLQEATLAHVLLVPTPPFKKQGDFDLVDGKLANGELLQLTYSGIGYYRPEFYQQLPEGPSSSVPLLRNGADAGEIAASMLDGTWEDVGTAERLERVRHTVG